jgi:signal peptidase I
MPGFEGGSAPPRLGAFGRLARRLRSRRLVVQDRSMEPEFRPGDRLLLDPAAYRTVDPAYGDVVVVEDPFDMERFLLKRVAGLPGDYIRVTATGAERRTGPADEGAPPGALEEFHIPPSQYFVLSDRTYRTRDSRQFGPVARQRVLGRVWKRTFPSGRVQEL